jgi:hypothetical protein
MNIISDIPSDKLLPSDDKVMRCAPNKTFDYSCISLDMLIKMAHVFNKDNSNVIQLFKINEICPKKYKKYLVNIFINKYGNDHREWIKQDFIKYLDKDDKEELENNTFRPVGPEGKFEWLSTLDINYVLCQYENKYKGFKFLGAVPIDFNDLDYYPFKKMTFADLQSQNIHKIGIIFNFDKHYQGGSHWVSLYSDLSQGHIYYSDSYGTPPKKEIQAFMDRIKNYLSLKNISIDMRYNKTVHQQGNSECGVYSINFILRLLKGKSFDHVTRKRIKDEKVNKCRLKYFSNASN